MYLISKMDYKIWTNGEVPYPMIPMDCVRL